MMPNIDKKRVRRKEDKKMIGTMIIVWHGILVTATRQCSSYQQMRRGEMAWHGIA
jgi:hypothetical protein